MKDVGKLQLEERISLGLFILTVMLIFLGIGNAVKTYFDKTEQSQVARQPEIRLAD